MKKLLYALLISLAFGNAVVAADRGDALLRELVDQIDEMQKEEVLDAVEKTTFQKVVGVPAAFVKIAKKHPKFVIGAATVLGSLATYKFVANNYGQYDFVDELNVELDAKDLNVNAKLEEYKEAGWVNVKSEEVKNDKKEIVSHKFTADPKDAVKTDEWWAKPNTFADNSGKSLANGAYKYSGSKWVKENTWDAKKVQNFRNGVFEKCGSAKDGVASAADTTYGYAWRDHGAPVKAVITLGEVTTIVLLYKYIKKHHPKFINKIAGIADLKLIEA